jgi:hypothetical protein
MGPSPLDVMTGAERNRMDAVIGASIGRLTGAGRLPGARINAKEVMPDVEGADAVNAKRASMLAAPVVSSSAGRQSDPDGSAQLLATRLQGDVRVLVGVIYVEQEVAIPNYPSVPPGDYAVWAASSGGTWTAELQRTDGNVIRLPAENVEVLGGATDPAVVVVGLAFVHPTAPPISLCLFRECG